MLLSIYIVAIFLLSNRYPQFMHIIKLEAQRDSYIRSQTSGLDVESILAKLSRIMIEQKLYINEDLTIGMLASQLEINTHQLSEILNLRIGKNFYNYINQLRIEEAKRMLTDEPGSNILSISIAVGYNTTSAFYNAFKKYMGISPSSYRKKNSISRK
jgi:YesN/AraC family two-component response regulator